MKTITKFPDVLLLIWALLTLVTMAPSLHAADGSFGNVTMTGNLKVGGYGRFDDYVSGNSTGGGPGSTGNWALAIGQGATAAGDHAYALGPGASGNGSYSVAIGHGALTSSTAAQSVAVGESASVYTTDAIALGSYANVSLSGNWGVAIGANSTVSGIYGVTLGRNATASGNTAVAIGYNSTASGNQSLTLGNNLTAIVYQSVVLGVYNNPQSGSGSGWVPTEDLLVVGNGNIAGNQTSNALVIKKNGNIGIGNYTGNLSSNLTVNGTIQFTKRQGDIVMGEFGNGSD
jgi:hypothetical protein